MSVTDVNLELFDGTQMSRFKIEWKWMEGSEGKIIVKKKITALFDVCQPAIILMDIL